MFTKFLSKRSAIVAVTALLAAAPLTEASAFPSPGVTKALSSDSSGAQTTDIAFRGRGFGRGGRAFGGGRGFGGRHFGGGARFGGRGGWNRGWRGRGWRGGGYYGGGYGYGIGAGVAGLAAGALIGGAIASSAADAAPAGDSVAYCESRFKSYDPASGTYLGYDGQRHACP